MASSFPTSDFNPALPPSIPLTAAAGKAPKFSEFKSNPSFAFFSTSSSSSTSAANPAAAAGTGTGTGTGTGAGTTAAVRQRLTLKQRRVSTSALPTTQQQTGKPTSWTFRDEMGISSNGDGQPSTFHYVAPPPPQQEETRGRKGKTRKLVKDEDAACKARADSPVNLDGDESEVQNAAVKKPRRNMWTEEETNQLVAGCNVWGVGNWKAILQDPQFTFQNRSPVDLKDRFRTYFPDAYRHHYPNAKTHLSDRVRASLPDGSSIFEKTRSKKRRPFTPEEDEALRRGYEEHGTVWAIIVKDPTFQNRRSTDLRDRFRNAFPDLYERAGYKPRPTRKLKKSRSEPLPADEEAARAARAPQRRKRTSAMGDKLFPAFVEDTKESKLFVDSPGCSDSGGEDSSGGEEEQPGRMSRSQFRLREDSLDQCLRMPDDGKSTTMTSPELFSLNDIVCSPDDPTPSHHNSFSESYPASEVGGNGDDSFNWIQSASSSSSDFFLHSPTSSPSRIGNSAWGPQSWLSQNPRLDGGPLAAWPTPQSEYGVLDRYDLYSAVSAAHDFASEAGGGHHHYHHSHPDQSIFRGFTHHHRAGDLIFGQGVFQDQEFEYHSTTSSQAALGQLSQLTLHGPEDFNSLRLEEAVEVPITPPLIPEQIAAGIPNAAMESVMKPEVLAEAESADLQLLARIPDARPLDEAMTPTTALMPTTNPRPPSPLDIADPLIHRNIHQQPAPVIATSQLPLHTQTQSHYRSFSQPPSDHRTPAPTSLFGRLNDSIFLPQHFEHYSSFPSEMEPLSTAALDLHYPPFVHPSLNLPFTPPPTITEEALDLAASSYTHTSPRSYHHRVQSVISPKDLVRNRGSDKKRKRVSWDGGSSSSPLFDPAATAVKDS